MKTWKQGIFSVLVIFALLLAFTACDDGKDTHTHDYSTTWSKDATQHWHECTANDGAKTDIAPHTAGDWIIDPQATYDTDGSQHKKCTVCEYTTDTETITKFKTEQPFTIGSVNFIFEYRKDDTVSWGKLEPAIESYRTNISSVPDGAAAITIGDLAARVGANYKIVVDYSNEGKSSGFVATDAQTLTVGNEYLATTDQTRTILRNAFNAMYAEPWPII
jgi:hypothetical protein